MDKLTKKGLRDKNGEGSSSGSHDKNKNTMKTHGELALSWTRPHNFPPAFIESPRYTMLKFLETKAMGVSFYNELEETL